MQTILPSLILERNYLKNIVIVLDPLSEDRKRKESRKGQTHSLAKQKMSDIRRGVSKTLNLVTCPHCGKSGKGGNMTRYHFDKCQTLLP
jgi:hypothetical protein